MNLHFASPCKNLLWIALFSSLLAACGGGSAAGGTSAQADDTSETGSNTSGGNTDGDTSGTTTFPNSDTPTTPPPPTLPPPPLPALTTGDITSVDVVNTGSNAQNFVPLTYGEVFAPGEIASSTGVAIKLADGTAVPYQFNVKARHADGSVRHAIVSVDLSQLPAGATQKVMLSHTATPLVTPIGEGPQTLLASGFTANVKLIVGGTLYTVSADDLLRNGTYTTWLSGPIVNEWLVDAPFKTADGAEHPHLSARFAIRSYKDINKTRVDVTVENDWAYEPDPQNFTYDVDVQVGGQSVYNKTALKHFHHARWRKLFWWGDTPVMHIKHDIPHLLASRAVPHYDPALKISAAGLSAMKTRAAGKVTEPMGPGIVVTAMPMTGGRPDIGPLPQWGATYLLTMDRELKDITLTAADLAGSWPVHYRDKSKDLPVSMDDYPYMTLLGHPGDAVNPVTKQSELFPACGSNGCDTAPYNYNPDGAHQPSLTYLPYLVTGDYYYLEELQFWSNWTMLRANPGYRGSEKGLIGWDEVRGQAWDMRTLGQTAYITPDDHPLKAYFNKRLQNNLTFYNDTYGENANANKLGVLDGSAVGGHGFMPMAYKMGGIERRGIAPWQDDFFTWSMGYLLDLGFAEAAPILTWKARFPIDRMTAPGFCWIDGSIYELAVRDNATAPLYGSLVEAYQKSMVNDDNTPLTNSTGAKYLDQVCNSQAQADWRTQKDKDNKVTRSAWSVGEMTGYATSTEGFPSNMQPALAVAAGTNWPQAKQAWSVFIARPLKPDYSTAPQWAIVPRE